MTTTKTLTNGDDTFTTSGITTDFVDASAGTDTLIVADVQDIATAAKGAKFKNFETMRITGTADTSHVAGITAIEIGGTSILSKLTADQAANITVRVDAGASRFARADATGPLTFLP